MRTLSILSIVVLLSACASAPRYSYVKEGVSSEGVRTAIAKCDYQIQLQKTPPDQQAALKRLCMEGEGFRLKRVG